ncbi:hypothetical protein CJ010_10910 [Azoarcus sp. DD4]|uniref:methane monooxygenase/ammonia monooxygenase subunit C n=1 Tax=Azoarcus sp. DD4 TaxID=2027405 RepID=UPI00112CF85B|nr:methane monooxygenase/ammonia monooxygenase subunit C [Azoarcus sp. DD4]QDF97001.1 hypothetical protein CJ010_10910 [Azoarcus sp. DD4]
MNTNPLVIAAARLWATEAGPVIAAAAAVTAMFAVGLYLASSFGALGAELSTGVPSISLLRLIPVWLAEGGFALALWSRIRRSSDPAVELSAAEEVRRSLVLVAWLALHILAVLVTTAALGAIDTPWRDAATGASEVTSPGHVVTYVSAIPAYILAGGGAHAYARARLRRFAHLNFHHFMIVAVGPFVFLPVIDVQQLIHSFDPDAIDYLVAYWVVIAAWTTNTGWLVTKLFRHILARMPASPTA